MHRFQVFLKNSVLLYLNNVLADFKGVKLNLKTVNNCFQFKNCNSKTVEPFVFRKKCMQYTFFLHFDTPTIERSSAMFGQKRRSLSLKKLTLARRKLELLRSYIIFDGSKLYNFDVIIFIYIESMRKIIEHSPLCFFVHK